MRWEVRKHGIAAVALLVVAVVLVTVHNDFVADFPALHFRTDRPHDAGGIRPCNVIGIFVSIERRNGNAQSSPNTVIIDARRHHEHEHVMAVELPRRQHLDLHGLVGRPVPLFADGPGIHLFRNVTDRRDFSDFIKIFQAASGIRGCGLLDRNDLTHETLPGAYSRLLGLIGSVWSYWLQCSMTLFRLKRNIALTRRLRRLRC